MTLEIIPAIDLRDGRCVRLRQGDYSRETVFSDDPVAVAAEWSQQGATRLHVVDLDGAKAGRPANGDIVRRIVAECRCPVQLGGGLREDDHVTEMLEGAGVSRVIIGTKALKHPDWFRGVCQRHPGRVALGLDARDSMVATDGWLEVSQTSAIELASQFADLLPLAVIYTNIANDGMMQGVDEGTISDMVQLCELGFDVIASGGVTTAADVRRLSSVHTESPRLVGAIVGRALYEGTLSLEEAHGVVQPAGGAE